MTRQIGYVSTTAQRVGGQGRGIETLKKRAQLPEGQAVGAVASLHTLNGAGPTILAANTNQMISMEDGITGNFDASDASVFANAANGGAVWGIQVLKSGTVRFDFNCFLTGGTNNVQFDAYQSTDGGVLSQWQAGRTGATTGDGWDTGRASNVTHVFWSQRVSFDVVDVPSVTVVFNGLGGTLNATVDWAVWAVFESGVYLPNI